MADPQIVPGTATSISTGGAFQEAPTPGDLRLGVVVAGVTGTLIVPAVTESGGRTTSIVSAIDALLSMDAALISRLATYDFGDGPVPAIFTVDPAPENSPVPLIVISQDLGAQGNGSRAGRAVSAGGAVTVWSENTQSSLELEAIGWDIWRILDRGVIMTELFSEILLSAGAPQSIIDPDGYPGRIVTWSATAYETT